MPTLPQIDSHFLQLRISNDVCLFSPLCAATHFLLLPPGQMSHPMIFNEHQLGGKPCTRLREQQWTPPWQTRGTVHSARRQRAKCLLHAWHLQGRAAHRPDSPCGLEIRMWTVTAEMLLGYFFPSRCPVPFSQVFSIKSPLNCVFIMPFHCRGYKLKCLLGPAIFIHLAQILYIKHIWVFSPSIKNMLSTICFS